MSGFSRSLRSPSYLTARRRPAMPGRTVSGSSERSMASDDCAEHLASGQTTPLPAYQRRYASSSNVATDSAPTTPVRECFGSARPMAIEIPRMNRLNNNNSTAQTPPEPLSARGDLPGGYFPLHEDPNSRIHRPHPFHPQNRAATLQNHALSDSDILGDLDCTSVPQISTTSPNMSTSQHIPVQSYYPMGYSENSLPMGKYYPSNYESRKAAKGKNKKKRTASTSSVEPENPRPDGPSLDGPSSPSLANKVESRRRLQQYQRDMMAQASLRAYELLAGVGGFGGRGSSTSNLQALRGLPPSATLGPSSLRKPHSPRLHPLGSPGPVTPMELEAESADGNYLDLGGAAAPEDPLDPLDSLDSLEDTPMDPPGNGYPSHPM